ncbi:LysR family transcriptional regulator [Marinobacter salarius]|uniref:LysR family transcriptional regulator n=1 Tax=Marinobacter salarius TaxID=1420917 RepID=UPI003BACF658
MKWSLDQLRTFLCVADIGGFSRAGEKLFLAQSTVSWQVQQIERQIGVPLLQRHSDGVTLTEKGMAFYVKAKKIVAANDEAELWLAQGGEERRVIRLATTECYANCLLPGILKNWKQQFPEVQVSLDCSFSTDIWSRYRNGEFDIALSNHCPPDVSGETVRVESLDWVCAEGSLVWKQDTLPVALFEHGCPDREIILNALKGAERNYQIEFETYSYGGLVAALNSGAVISALPRSTIPHTLKSLNATHLLPGLPSLNVSLASPGRNTTGIWCQLYTSMALQLGDSHRPPALVNSLPREPLVDSVVTIP